MNYRSVITSPSMWRLLFMNASGAAGHNAKLHGIVIYIYIAYAHQMNDVFPQGEL